MKYVIPFTDDLDQHEEAIVSEVRESLATGRYTSGNEALRVIDRLQEVVEGLREHSQKLEEELKGAYKNEFQQLSRELRTGVLWNRRAR